MRKDVTIPLSTVVLGTLGAVFNASKSKHAGGNSQEKDPFPKGDLAARPRIIRWTLRRMTQRLKLTEEQKTRVQSIIDTHLSQLETLLHEMLDTHNRILPLERRSNLDEHEVNALATRQAELIKSVIIIWAHIRYRIINEVLTPDQRAQAEEFRKGLETRAEAWLRR